jgi:hypothetical protein
MKLRDISPRIEPFPMTIQFKGKLLLRTELWGVKAKAQHQTKKCLCPKSSTISSGNDGGLKDTFLFWHRNSCDCWWIQSLLLLCLFVGNLIEGRRSIIVFIGQLHYIHEFHSTLEWTPMEDSGTLRVQFRCRSKSMLVNQFFKCITGFTVSSNFPDDDCQMHVEICE